MHLEIVSPQKVNGDRTSGRTVPASERIPGNGSLERCFTDRELTQHTRFCILLRILAKAMPGAERPSQITLDMVSVGDAKNPSDPRTGFGRVKYEYKISKYEITIEQYTTFLNTVAANDPYELYNFSMATDMAIAGIARSGSSGSYTYSMIGPSGAATEGASSPGNRPIAYIDWWDAARFANWMHNGRGAGDTETGAYTLNGTTTGLAVPANSGARFHIPTPDEWYKAAYYSPKLNKGKGGYFVFPTQHDATPGSVPNNNIKKRHSQNQAN
jgi:sulfatase modifying factor 1